MSFDTPRSLQGANFDFWFVPQTWVLTAFSYRLCYIMESSLLLSSPTTLLDMFIQTTLPYSTPHILAILPTSPAAKCPRCPCVIHIDAAFCPDIGERDFGLPSWFRWLAGPAYVLVDGEGMGFHSRADWMSLLESQFPKKNQILGGDFHLPADKALIFLQKNSRESLKCLKLWFRWFPLFLASCSPQMFSSKQIWSIGISMAVLFSRPRGTIEISKSFYFLWFPPFSQLVRPTSSPLSFGLHWLWAPWSKIRMWFVVDVLSLYKYSF